MNETQAERLLHLSDHIDHGKLGHRVLLMKEYNIGVIDERGCGTAGCMIGECPIAFPDDWIFDPDPILKGQSFTWPSAKTFFGLNSMESGMLFSGTAKSRRWYHASDMEMYRLPPMPPESVLAREESRVELAASLKRFVQWKREIGLDEEEEV